MYIEFSKQYLQEKREERGLLIEVFMSCLKMMAEL